MIRCVICQLKYKIGEQQMNLLCKHVYHSECISKWLNINKVYYSLHVLRFTSSVQLKRLYAYGMQICPVCNSEVFGEPSIH